MLHSSARISAWADRLVADGRLAGLSVDVIHRGEAVHGSVHGLADIGRGTPWSSDTIVRIYSMTKPLTTAAALMLYEEGCFQLDDPVERFLPAFAGARVFTGGSRLKMETEPARRPPTIRDLMTHTSGLSYGFMEATPVDAAYREAGIDFQNADGTLAELVDKLAAIPLLAQPGTAWNYSVATDVLGRLVEVWSGEPFDVFLQRRVLDPLGMADTSFRLPPAKLPRFAACYMRGSRGQLVPIDDPAESVFLRDRLPSGGGGLVGTASDYMRFCRLILGGGTFEGQRLLGRKTVELMTANHLGGDLASMGQARFSESTYEGIGFGLGFSVMLDPARAQILGTPGEVAWGGAASTAFWIDRAEDLAVVMLTQMYPSSTYPIRRELRTLVYAGL